MPQPRILAIDYGSVRIGLALSDELKIIASPLERVQSASPAKNVECIVQYIHMLATTKNYVIGEIVIGLPRNMNGSDSKTTTIVREFSTLLQKALPDIPVRLFDERLSSVQAERMLKEVAFTRKKRAAFVDSVSAVIILQSYLNATTVSPFSIPS